jgi:hypothetical protein
MNPPDMPMDPGPPQDPDPPNNPPVATSCGSVAFACYDEHPGQSVGLINFRPNSRWPKTDLTWRLTNTLPSIDAQVQIDAIDRAFKVWASRSTLRFTQVNDNADINVSFENDDPGQPNPFDGPGGFLGRAFFPGTARAGTVELCADETWGAAGQGGKIDLFTVVLHEIGHALGLEHLQSDTAVMRPGYGGPIENLTQVDIDAIQRLYGSRDGTVQPVGFGGGPGQAPNLAELSVPDADGDGLPDVVEVFWFGTNPQNADSDADGADDFTEIFITGTPPLFGGSDADNDGIPDAEEISIYGTNPGNFDTDADFLEDGVEIFFFGTNPNTSDSDFDGLPDAQEIFFTGTDPLDPDTDFDGLIDGQDPNPLLPQDSDFDGLPDGIEVFFFDTNPFVPDTDRDGFSDGQEVNSTPGSDPLDPFDTQFAPNDSDQDGCSDFDEIAFGFCDADPFTPTQGFNDFDQDGLSNDDEAFLGTDPFNPDSDFDGFSDGQEVNNTPGSDPLDPFDTQFDPFDSDQDGCSDFDELVFGFCDADPFSSF